MIFLRSLLFTISFWIWSVFVAFAMIPTLLLPYRAGLWCLRIWSAGITLLLRVCCNVKTEFRGLEHQPHGPAIVAPKHQSMYDVFSQFAFVPSALFVMKKELVWIPLFAWYGLKIGCIVVDRETGSTALRKMVAAAKDRFKEPRQLMIFPEGTRKRPGAEPDYKPGVAALYRELDVPVHPVATNSGAHWANRGFNTSPGTIVFEYLEPIPPGLKRGEFMRLLQERVEAGSERLKDL